MSSKTFTLQLQSVVYNNSIENIEKLVRSLSVSSASAIKQGVVSHAVHRIGDCSPSQLIPNPDQWCKKNSTDALTIEYVYFDQNYGHGGGQNQLAQNSFAEIIGVVNPDVVASPHLVENLCAEFEDPSVGVSEASQIPMEHPKNYDLDTRETSFSSGCCMFIRRELFESIGAFDHENFFMYCDDVDLSWRVRLSNKKIIFCPTAFVYHDHRIGNDGNLEVGFTEFYYSAVGAIMLAYKWGRSDIAEHNIEQLRDNAEYKDVVAEIDEKIAAGKIPETIPNADKVALFTPDGFADYRWVH